MLEDILKGAEVGMQKAVEVYQVELGKLRTGRAHPGLVDGVKLDYYGNETTLKHIANITVSDARTIVVTPWEKNLVKNIEKAIQNADLGLNPISDGHLVRVPIPPLTEERRREMVKIVKGIAENARVAVRNVRRDAMERLKASLKSKELDEDAERRAQERVQKITDGFVAEIDKLALSKEADLLKI